MLLKNAAQVLTKQEKQALYEQQKLEKRKLQEDADMRKNVMQKLEVDRRCNEKISDIEQVCYVLIVVHLLKNHASPKLLV